MLDAGSWSQGTHNIYILARAANGASSWGYGTFLIDNTPVVTVQSPGQVEGVFDIFGTIRFKGRVDGKEGSAQIYINGKDVGHYEGWKEYEGTTINWSYSQIVGRTLNAASWPQAIHTVYVRAKAYNNAYSEWAQGTFEVTQFQLAKNLGRRLRPLRNSSENDQSHQLRCWKQVSEGN